MRRTVPSRPAPFGVAAAVAVRFRAVAARAGGLLVVCGLLAVPVAAGDFTILPVAAGERPVRHEGVLAEAAVEAAPGSLRSLQGALSTPGNQLFLPLYEQAVDGSLTTLFAARNLEASEQFLTASYFDRAGNFIRNESFVVPPGGVMTRNLRDVFGLPVEADSVRRGFLFVSGGFMSGDTFRVDPGSDFASGDRLIVSSRPYLCSEWELRFLRGGGFSGGTDMVIVVDTPLGADSLGDQPSLEIAVFNEAGVLFGTVDLWTDLMVNKLTASEVLAAIGEPALNAGIFEFTFHPSSGGGLVQATYSAEGRYSIGLQGGCS